MTRHHVLAASFLAALLLAACAARAPQQLGHPPASGEWLELTLRPNPEVYPHFFGTRYPQLAIWLAREDGSAPQSLFVTAKAAKQTWIGAKARPEALPIWEGIRSAENAAQIAAVSGATPMGEMIVLSAPLPPQYQGQRLSVFVEANVSFDFNAQYPQPAAGDPAPKTSAVNGQPSILFAASLAPAADGTACAFVPVGLGDALGLDHEVRTELDRLSSATRLFRSLTVRRLTAMAK